MNYVLGIIFALSPFVALASTLTCLYYGGWFAVLVILVASVAVVLLVAALAWAYELTK